MTSVLQVVTSTDRRGAEVSALDLAGALGRRGTEVETVALVAGSTGGLPLDVLGTTSRAPATIRALRRRAREHAVVVGHGGDTLSACTLALAGTGVPFVYRNIGDPLHWSGTRRKLLQQGLLLRRSRAVVAIADGAADVLAGHFGVADERIRVIPTGVSGDRFVPAADEARRAARSRWDLPGDDPVIAVVAALSPEKDVGLAIDTLAGWSPATLLVVGDGPERAALEAHARSTAADRVRFVGALADTREAYAAADVLLLTSRTEGLPGVLVEAGLAGLPAVATDVGYVREVVVDDITGFVVPRDAAQLRAALEQALSRHVELGGAARERCLASFELESIADRWVELLDAVRR